MATSELLSNYCSRVHVSWLHIKAAQRNSIELPHSLLNFSSVEESLLAFMKIDGDHKDLRLNGVLLQN